MKKREPDMSHAGWEDRAKPLLLRMAESPPFVLLVLFVAILVVRWIIVVLFDFLPPLHPSVRIILGAAVVSILLFSILYVFVFRDLIRQVRQRRTAEEALKANERKVQDELRESEKHYRDVVEFCPDGVAIHQEGKIVFANTAAARIMGSDNPKEFIGKPVMDFVHPDDRDVVMARIKDLVERGQPVPLIAEKFLRSDGSVVNVETKGVPFEHKGKPAILVFFRDITGYKQAEEKGRMYTQRIRAVHEASQALVASLDFREVVDKCVMVARDTIDVDGAAIFLVDEKGTHLEPVISLEAYADKVMSMRLEMGEGITGGVAASGQAEIVNRVDLTGRGKLIPGTPVEAESLLSAPLLVKGNVIGVMTLRRLGEREFADDDLELVENLANIAASAIENARLYGKILESDEKSRTLIEKAPDPVIVLDQQGIINRWNESATRVFGFGEKEMIGRSFETLCASSEGWEVCKEKLETLVKRGESSTPASHLDLEALRKDGQVINVLLTASSTRSDGGQLFTVFMKDMTEAKRAQEEIKRLAAFPRENPEPVIEMNSKGSPLYINPAGRQLLSQLKVEPENIARILPLKYKEIVKGSLKTGKDTLGEVVKLDHTVLLWYAHPLKELSLVHFYSLDISDRVKAEEALKTSKEYTENIIRSSLDMIIAVDNDRRITEFNKAAEETFGYTQKEVLGENVSILYADKNQGEAVHKSTVKKGRHIEEILNRRKNGEEFPSLLSASVLLDSDGNRVGVMGVSRDITEMRRAQERVRKLNEELEERVMRRTAELQVANQELESFAYSISHDLRTPLRTIDGFSQILLEDYGDKFDALGKDYLQRVSEGAIHLAQLTDDLLELSRVTRSKITFEKVDLTAIANEVAEQLKQLEPERKVDFVIHKGLVTVGDSSLLKVVLDNLLENAWKFTAPMPRAKIEFGARKDNRQPAYFVQDNGVGFDMAYVEKLFIPFERLHGEDEFKGTGIGLASVKRIIQRHGGLVWAEGKEGAGATFHFTLRTEKENQDG